MVEICISEMGGITYKKEKCGLQDIFYEVCDIFDKKPHVVRSKNRSTDVVMCRYIVSYVTHMTSGITMHKISLFLGYNDHTSVATSIKKVNNWISVKDGSFMRYWNLYISKSEIWKRYDKK